jgi:hypothetical protein
MSGPTASLSDVKLVMTETPGRRQTSKALDNAEIEVKVSARLAFLDAASSRNWARYLAAARTLLAAREAADARRAARARREST